MKRNKVGIVGLGPVGSILGAYLVRGGMQVYGVEQAAAACEPRVIDATRQILEEVPGVKVIANMRPVHPVGVICGDQAYPDDEQITQWLGALTEKTWLLNTTREAARLGNPIFSNVIMVGALAATGELPLTREGFETVIRRRMPEDKAALNLEAFDIGRKLVS